MSKDGAAGQEPDVEALVGSIDRTPIPTIVTDNRRPDNPIIAVNQAFVDLTGYPATECIGRNCRFLGGPATEPEARQVLRQAIEQGRPALVELTNYRRDGTPFRNAVMIAPVLDGDGKALLFVGSQLDVGKNARSAGSRESRARSLVEGLTPRQRQVLTRMAVGLRNKQIGAELGIDEKTVKMHRRRMLDALGVPTSADAIRIAVESGVLSSPD